MGKEDVESQIERNTAARVALAGATIAGLIVIVAGRKQIVRQIIQAIKTLPDFYESCKKNAQNASLPIFETGSPELADEALSLLMDKKRGSERLYVSPGSVAFLTPEVRSLEQARAVKTIIPFIYAVLSQELDPVKRGRVYALRLTGRNLDPRPPKDFNIIPVN